jgi:hypothetical protein
MQRTGLAAGLVPTLVVKVPLGALAAVASARILLPSFDRRLEAALVEARARLLHLFLAVGSELGRQLDDLACQVALGMDDRRGRGLTRTLLAPRAGGGPFWNRLLVLVNSRPR